MDQLQFQRSKFLGGMKAALELLKSDLELLREGYEFYDVVDFAALYAHVYKTPGLPILSIEGEPEAVLAARSQMALQLLFTEYPRTLLIILPYSDELRNHLLHLNTALQTAELQAKLTRKENLKRMIENSEAFKSFLSTSLLRSATDNPVEGGLSDSAGIAVVDDDPGIKKFLEVSRPGAPDTKLRNAALKVAKEFFPELYAVTAALPVVNRSIFTSLFRDKIVMDVDEAIPKLRDLEYQSDSVDRWFSSINTRRKGKRAFQTRTDAMACTYVEHANAQLNEARKVVLFVSPSESVSNALARSSVLSGGGGSELPVVRNLTYCVMAATHKGDFDKRDEEINKSLAIVGRLLELYESPLPVSWQTRQKREQAALDWKRCENLFLVSGTTITDAGNHGPSVDRDGEFLRIIAELHAAGTEGRESLLRELERDREKLVGEIAELNKLIPALDPRSAYSKYISIQRGDEKAKGIRIEFPGLSDEIPFKLTFYDRRMVGVAQFLKRLSDSSDQEAVLALRPNVLNLASQPNATPEHHLLAGFILVLEERYETALGELKSGLSKVKDDPAVELKFVAAVVLRKLNRAREAIELLEKALEEDPSDFRLHIEMANTLWLKWRERPDAMHVHPELNLAIDHLRRAKQSLSSQGNSGQTSALAKAQIENISAFLRTERALVSKWSQTKDLTEAERHIEQMLKFQAEDGWIGRFFDTRGYWHYAKSKVPTVPVPEKKQLLTTAASYVEKALQSPEDFADGIKIRREHEKLIACELANFAD